MTTRLLLACMLWRRLDSGNGGKGRGGKGCGPRFNDGGYRSEADEKDRRHGDM